MMCVCDKLNWMENGKWMDGKWIEWMWKVDGKWMWIEWMWMWKVARFRISHLYRFQVMADYSSNFR